jgi:hypothetical protein
LPEDVNKTIVESSIVFVSIFATIGLLIGASSSQFKTTYVYLGYMLVYSLPFILACSFCIVSMLSDDENSGIARVISLIGVTFFITGLIMLAFLASSAVQTSMLPMNYVFLLPSSSLTTVEIYLFVMIVGFSFVGLASFSKFKRLWKVRNWISSISATLFIIIIGFMMVSGVRQLSFVAASGTASLSGGPNYSTYNTSFYLQTTDQLQVRMNSSENFGFGYTLLDESNYLLYSNSSASSLTVPLQSGFYSSNYSFPEVISASSNYYLILLGETLSTNVTFSVLVTRTDNSYQVDALVLSSPFVSLLIATIMARPQFSKKTLNLFGKERKKRKILARTK